jgi:Tfp pilus assembly protein PilO
MSKLSPQWVLILGVATLLVVGYICYKYTISPQLEYLHAAKRQLASQENLLQTRKQKAEDITLLQKKSTKLRSKLDFIQNRLFNDTMANDFLRSLPQLTKETNNNLTYIKFFKKEIISIGDTLRNPSEEAMTEGEVSYFEKLPIQLTIRGKYVNIIKLLDRIGNYEKLISISSLQIDTDEKTLPEIELRLKIFLYIDQSNTSNA